MPTVFSDPASGFIWLLAMVLAPLLTWMVSKRKQQTDSYGALVEDALTLKEQFQEDYERLRKRLGDTERQLVDTKRLLIILQQRMLTLESENLHLRSQVMAAGLVVAAPDTTPLPESGRQGQGQGQARRKRGPRRRKPASQWDAMDPIEEN